MEKVLVDIHYWDKELSFSGYVHISSIEEYLNECKGLGATHIRFTSDEDVSYLTPVLTRIETDEEFEERKKRLESPADNYEYKVYLKLKEKYESK